MGNAQEQLPVSDRNKLNYFALSKLSSLSNLNIPKEGSVLRTEWLRFT
ncbi:hypothetical protein [Nostoc sp.]